jgi:hypothetical protein
MAFSRWPAKRLLLLATVWGMVLAWLVARRLSKDPLRSQQARTRALAFARVRSLPSDARRSRAMKR